MDALTQALLPLRLEDERLGIHYIAPPTVDQALHLHALLPHWEIEEHQERIREIAARWLGGPRFKRWTSKFWRRFRVLQPQTQAITLRMLLAACEPEADRTSEKTQRDLSMTSLVAEYCHWFGSNVWTISWPVFLVLMGELTRLKAEAGIANLAWYAAGKSEKVFEELMKRAGYRDPPHLDPATEQKIRDYDEVVRASAQTPDGFQELVQKKREQA